MGVKGLMSFIEKAFKNTQSSEPSAEAKQPTQQLRGIVLVDALSILMGLVDKLLMPPRKRDDTRAEIAPADQDAELLRRSRVIALRQLLADYSQIHAEVAKFVQALSRSCTALY